MRTFSRFEQLPNLAELQTYQVDAVTGATYIRYNDNTNHELIIKITVAGTLTTIEKAFDLWTNRASATYIAINDKFIEGTNTPTPLN